MQAFKKAIASTLAFILIFTAFSAVVIETFINSDFYYYNDVDSREELAGTLDTLYCGSSHGLCAFSPDVIDSITGSSSYNLCGALTTLSGMHKMLETEIERNPIRTVYVEVCFNTLTRDESAEGDEGEFYILSRIENPAERLSYLFSTVAFENYASMYSSLMMKGLSTIKRYVFGTAEHEGSMWDGQHRLYESENQMIPLEQIDALKNSEPYDYIPLDENIVKFERIIELCRMYDTRVVFVVTPIADSVIWKASTFDKSMEWFTKYCEKNNIEYYDFNLLKDRRSIISDSTSFYDTLHLTADSADRFSASFADIMLRIDSGEDVSDLFYASYEEYKETAPYSQYYELMSPAEETDG